ncbi:MAG: PD-(D/E)XK nuclease family protein, partial [Bacteroidia bacterium]
GEEKSRYIRQVEYYLTKENPNLKIQHRYYSLPLKTQSPQEIIIEKDAQYFERISAKSAHTGLSPSLISSYFTCSLQFLINHVIQLRAKEDISEDMDASQLGILYHGVMENLYKAFLGKTIYADDIKSCKSRLSDATSDVLMQIYKKESLKEFMERRNSLLVETVKVLAEKTLDEDLKYAPFKLLHLEETLYYTLNFENETSKPIKLKGIIDRVDEKDGLVRIIDYKTGMLDKKYFNYNDPEEAITTGNKEAFQTLFYTYLYKNTYGAQRLQPTILPLKKVNEGYVVVNEKDGDLNDDHFVAFENKLKEIIHTVLDKEQPIVQIEDLSVCGMCNYTSICLR